jgi:hypothetical protein
MPVRPKDLKEGNAAPLVLYCGDCVTDYSAARADYDWMFPGDTICCMACGLELMLTEKVMIEL